MCWIRRHKFKKLKWCYVVKTGIAAAAKSLQLCPTLCDSIDGSPPGSSVAGILQARTLEWVAISFSNAWKWKVKVKSLNHLRLLATLWTAAYQIPPSMGFSRQEYWSGLPLSPSKMVVGGEIAFRVKPHTHQRCSESSNKLCVQKDPETPQRLSQNCISVSPVEVR